MLQKNSILVSSDNTGVIKVKIFHVYKYGKGIIGTVNFFIFVSIKRKYARDDVKLLRKYVKFRIRNCIIRTKYYLLNNDKQYIKSKYNAAIIYSKKLERYKLKIRGPLFFNLRRIRYFLLSKYIV